MTKTINHDEMIEGQRIYYTGDMANGASFGTIVNVRESKEWGKSYDIEMDEERFDNDSKRTNVSPNAFYPGPGTRFQTAEAYKAEREAGMKRFLNSVNRKEVIA